MLFQQLKNFTLVDSELTLQSQYTPDIVIRISKLAWRNEGSRHQGSGEVAIAGITIGALSALDGVIARSVIGAENFGAVMGGIGLLSTLGGSLGPILGGQLRDWSGSPVASMILVAATAWLATVVFASLGLSRQDSATS